MISAPRSPSASWRDQAEAILAAGDRWRVLFTGFEMSIAQGLLEGRGLPRTGKPSPKQQAILDRLAARLALVEGRA